MTKQEIKMALEKSTFTKQTEEDLVFLREMDKDRIEGIFPIGCYNLGVIRGIQMERARKK